MHSPTLLSLALLSTPLTALPLRFPPPFLPAPPTNQQRPFIATTWTPSSNGGDSHRKLHTSYPHPSPLATATPLPSKPQPSEKDSEKKEDEKEDPPEYGPICNLGHRTPVNIEDAVEVAYALCQGGIMDRSTVSTKDGEGTEEVLECLACEWGTWNADREKENK